jgi:hypothetical protein
MHRKLGTAGGCGPGAAARCHGEDGAGRTAQTLSPAEGPGRWWATGRARAATTAAASGRCRSGSCEACTVRSGLAPARRPETQPLLSHPGTAWRSSRSRDARRMSWMLKRCSLARSKIKDPRPKGRGIPRSGCSGVGRRPACNVPRSCTMGRNPTLTDLGRSAL